MISLILIQKTIHPKYCLLIAFLSIYLFCNSIANKMSDIPPRERISTPRAQRIDYAALNDGRIATSHSRAVSTPLPQPAIPLFPISSPLLPPPALAPEASTSFTSTSSALEESSSDENTEPPNSPSHAPAERRISSLVTMRKTRTVHKTRKNRKEHSWTLPYFRVSELPDDIWQNIHRRGKPTLKNRLWSCKYCSYSSTDKARSGSKTALGNHLKDKHRFTKLDHSLGNRITHGVVRSHQSSLDTHIAVMPPPL